MNKKILFVLLVALIIAFLVGIIDYLLGLGWSYEIKNLGSTVYFDEIKDVKVIAFYKSFIIKKREIEITINNKRVPIGINLVDALSGFGDYEIKAKCKNKEIIKKISLIRGYDEFNTDSNRAASLLIEHTENYEQIVDSDNDGITDKEEKEVYGSNPFNEDTDGDGFFDNNEIALGLDILEEDDLLKDVSFAIMNERYRLDIVGTGNIANTFVDEVEIKELEKNGFIVGKLIDITSHSEFVVDSIINLGIHFAVLTFNIDNIENADDVGIFYYDNENGKIEWIDSQLDDESNTISAVLNHFSLYGLGYKSKQPDELLTEIALVIDNSGSMFSVEQVEEITGRKLEEKEKDEYGYDTEYKRISLMDSLVSEVGDAFKFSVGVFQNSYYTVCEMTKDKKLVKNCLEKLKSEYHNFNGTDIENAGYRAIKEFSLESYNKKYMILLSDGYSTQGGWLDFSFYSIDDVIDKANDNNIKIITIGLGDCDNELLENIAAGTGGIYVHAEDANALELILSRLLVEVDELKEDTNNDGKDDIQVIADSGFLAEVDGFPFSNFGDKNSPDGNCYGFALTTKLIYEGMLPKEMTETELRGLGMAIMGETVLKPYKMGEKSVERLENNDTYKIDVPTLFLINSKDIPDDYRIVKDDVAVINPKYRQTLIDVGYDVYMKGVEEPIDVDGTKVYKYESVAGSFDAYSNRAIKNVPKEELDFIQIITRNQKAQGDRILEKRLNNLVIGDKNLQSKSSLTNPIKEQLEQGEPVVVGVECKLGRHAVLVTKMAYSLENPNKIYLTIYDSNTPGLNGIGTLERIKGVCMGNLIDKYCFNYEVYKLNFNSIAVENIDVFNGKELVYSTKD